MLSVSSVVKVKQTELKSSLHARGSQYKRRRKVVVVVVVVSRQVGLGLVEYVSDASLPTTRVFGFARSPRRCEC